MWAEHHAVACRKHADLLAVYEGRDGALALLLRQPLVPLNEQRGAWFNATRRASRAIVSSLRAAGLGRRFVVLQWRPPAQVAHILGRWTCRYDADPAHREQLIALMDERLVDRKLSGPQARAARERRRVPGPRAVPFAPGDAVVRSTLIEWYRDMASAWLAVEPPLRRRLILRTHRWIVGRVLGPLARGSTPSVEELRPDGTLAWMLTRVIPPAEVAAWQPWIRLVLVDLQRALRWPAARRNEAWARWLFLIPYSIPVNRRHPVDTASPAATGTT